MAVLGSVHSTETFGLSDGPGVRYVVFMQGCTMRCAYCHNADTWQIKEPDMTAEDILKKALRCKPYWKREGGITVSGGEPLLQMEFVSELFRLAKKKGVNTCLDTSGAPFRNDPDYLKRLDALLENTDLVLLDIKQIDSSRHKKLTSLPNENILAFAEYLDEKNIPVWIRHVLVPGITDDQQSLEGLAKFVKGLHNVKKLQVLPYHTLGAYKWKELGISYPLEGISECSRKKAEETEV